MKKIISAAFLSVFMLAALMFCSSAVVCIPGDSNMDGKVTASDARWTLRYSAKLEVCDNVLTKVASDINSDGKVTASDARLILRLSAKLESADSFETHDVELEQGTPADCTHDGVSDKVACTICGKVLYDHEKIAAGHKIQVIKGTESTCESKGSTDSEVCSVCGEVVKPSEEIPASDHKPSGDGVHCKWCDKVIFVYDDFKTFCSGTYKLAGTVTSGGETARITRYYSGDSTRTRTISSEGDITVLCRNLSTDPRVYIASEPNKTYTELDYDTAYYYGWDVYFYVVSAKLDPYAQNINVSNEVYHGRNCVVYGISTNQYTSRFFFENGKLVGVKDYENGECYLDCIVSEFTGSIPNDVWYLSGYRYLDFESFFESIG